MSKPKITKREFLLARAFLKRFGGNVQNTYLILAIVAWTRAMTKSHDAFWNSLSKLSAESAGLRLAKNLQSKAATSKYASEYKALITRLKQNLTKGTDQAAQAADFILGIEKSHYGKGHYGYKEYVEGHYETHWVYSGRGYPEQVTTWVPTQYAADPLRDAWAALTNHPNIPDSWWIKSSKTTVTKVIPPRPHQPRSLLHVLPTVDYIQPYAAAHFYDARPHYGDNVLLDDE